MNPTFPMIDLTSAFNSLTFAPPPPPTTPPPSTEPPPVLTPTKTRRYVCKFVPRQTEDPEPNTILNALKKPPSVQSQSLKNEKIQIKPKELLRLAQQKPELYHPHRRCRKETPPAVQTMTFATETPHAPPEAITLTAYQLRESVLFPGQNSPVAEKQ